MTGTGTQADPYVVTTWADLVTKASESGVYVKLGADINLNDEYPQGITAGCMLNCAEFDGDNHTIKNISAINQDYILKAGYSGTLNIKNCNFLNFRLEVNASNPGLTFFMDGQNRTVNFTNCKFSGSFTGKDYVAYISRGVTTFSYCSFNIQTHGNFRTTYEDNWFIFEYTNAAINGEFTSYLYFVLKNSYLSGTMTTGTSIWLVTGSTYGVIDMICPRVNGNSAEVCLANSDKVVGTINVATPVTTAQLTNAAYLASIGFPIQT